MTPNSALVHYNHSCTRDKQLLSETKRILLFFYGNPWWWFCKLGAIPKNCEVFISLLPLESSYSAIPLLCSSGIPAYAPLHSATCLWSECMTCWRSFSILSSCRAISVFLCIRYIFPPQSPPAHPTYTPPPPKPLAVISPSIVPVTAEHTSYACLFRAEEIITTSQQGSYRHQYVWCSCDTMCGTHADALCYELYSRISHSAMEHYCWQFPYFIWKFQFPECPCWRIFR